MSLSEHDRNRALRRVDWRFLAGEPVPRRTWCQPDSPFLEGLVSAGAEFADRDCDLAALSEPGRRDLRDAWERLRPGGVLYAEWHRPVPRARKRLAAEGYVDVACWWPWPSPRRASPQMWLPVDAPHALDWFLEDRANRSARGDALVGAWRLAHRLDLLVPLCAIARKPSWPGGATTPRSLAWQLESLAGGRADLLLLTGGRSTLNKVVALGFAQRTGPPIGVLKVPRVPESGPALRHEAEALALMRDRHGDVSGVPHVLAGEERRGIFVVEETFVGGTRVLESLTAENHERVALRVADLLARLVRHEAVVPARDAARAHLETARAELSVAESSKLETLVGALHGLPVTFEHRDCSPWNLHGDANGKLGLLDWEGAQINGLPLVDLLYYVGQATMLLAGAGSERQAYAAMLQPGTPAEGTLSRCIDRYVALTGLDREALRPLRALCWLVHVPAARRRQADGRAEGITHPELFVHLARSELGRP